MLVIDKLVVLCYYYYWFYYLLLAYWHYVEKCPVASTRQIKVTKFVLRCPYIGHPPWKGQADTFNQRRKAPVHACYYF